MLQFYFRKFFSLLSAIFKIHPANSRSLLWWKEVSIYYHLSKTIQFKTKSITFKKLNYIFYVTKRPYYFLCYIIIFLNVIALPKIQMLYVLCPTNHILLLLWNWIASGLAPKCFLKLASIREENSWILYHLISWRISLEMWDCNKCIKYLHSIGRFFQGI